MRSDLLKASAIFAASAAVLGSMAMNDAKQLPQRDGYPATASASASVPDSDTAETTVASIEIAPDGSVYITPSGKRWHLQKSCAGENAEQATKEEAEARGLTHCKKCAGG